MSLSSGKSGGRCTPTDFGSQYLLNSGGGDIDVMSFIMTGIEEEKLILSLSTLEHIVSSSYLYSPSYLYFYSSSYLYFSSYPLILTLPFISTFFAIPQDGSLWLHKMSLK